MEEIVNRTYNNIALYVRDLSLDKEVIDMYKKDLIIRETSFVDMTYKIGGINKNFNTRFIILSNKANDMQHLEEDTNWGLFVLGTNSYFKVLNNEVIDNINVITLLHINEYDVDFFKENTISIDNTLIKQVYVLMKQSFIEEPINDIDNDTWYKRVNFPIGIDDNNNFFEIKKD